jgi:RNA polymerase sigma-70 factor (ECF subfamily)
LETFEDRLTAELPALRRYGRVLCRQEDAAEDLLQDCVERALRHRHLWRRPGNFRAWLFRIMHNVHANDVRYRSRRPQTVPFEDSHAGSTMALQEMRAEISETLEAFGRLKESHREILLLIAVEGLSYREAAHVLSIPAGTVMSRMSRAREQLLELMQERAGARVRRIK